MALGGGTWLTQSKILPGSYINFISAANASATLSDRGIATMPLFLDWGVQGEIMEVSSGDFQKNSLKLFGYDYTAKELKGLRDLFKNIRLAYLFRLGSGGAKAKNKYATAKYVGTRGNGLKVVITSNVDDETSFDVSLYMDTTLVDVQTVKDIKELVNNDYVDWNTDATLSVNAGMPLMGGESPEEDKDEMSFTGGESPVEVNGNYQSYLDLVEGYSFNAIGCPSDDLEIKGLFTSFTKRMREEHGIKFQCVTYNNPADYEGVINVMNRAMDGDEWNAIYWVTGVVAGTAVNKSALNMAYDGEFEIDVNHTQSQLEKAIQGGKFAFHRVGSDIRVLSDINSLVNTTEEKGEDFKQNQTIRVIDQVANDIAVLFNNKYLGVVPNDSDGRVSLWSDIVKHHEQLQSIRAIENFSSDDVQVYQGDTKRTVVVNDVITVVNAMSQLYMVVQVS